MSTTRFALAQIDTCVGDLDGNAAKVIATTRMARERADVVVFPEMTLTGYPIEDLALRATFREAAWNKANELAAQLESEGMGGLYVVVGTVGTDHANGKPRNRLVVLHGGLVWAGYDKHFLPNYGVFDEFRIFSAGLSPAAGTIPPEQAVPAKGNAAFIRGAEADHQQRQREKFSK